MIVLRDRVQKVRRRGSVRQSQIMRYLSSAQTACVCSSSWQVVIAQCWHFPLICDRYRYYDICLYNSLTHQRNERNEHETNRNRRTTKYTFVIFCNCNCNCISITRHFVAHVSYSQAQMVFLGGHPVKYYPPTVVRAIYMWVRVTALSGINYSGPSW